MSQPKSVLLLNGSPKCEKSNSRVIGKYLANKLVEKGLKSEEVFIVRLLKNPQGKEQLSSLVNDADIVVFTTPLYVDSVPSFTIKAMESIADSRKANPQLKAPLLVAVINCGFPEKEHMEIALKIIRNFAVEANLRWGGAVSVGMGMALNGEPLEDKKGMTRNLTKGLSLAADALADGLPVPEEAEALAGKSFLPLALMKPVMVAFGKRMWVAQRNADGVKPDMYARPYERH